MSIANCFMNFLQGIDAPINIGEFLRLLSSSQHQCLFIKNANSNYSYANDNFIQLMGLENFAQLQRLTDYDIAKNKKDADTYREHDRYILEENKTLPVRETLYPSYNQPIVKTVQGKLYPLFANSDKANYILGIVSPECKLLKLDFNTLFELTQKELDELLIRRNYTINLSVGSITLSKMEIRTIVQLLKGAHAGEIAKTLLIKQNTVESYLVNIKNKLAVNHKSELIDRIISEKLLQQVML